MKLNIFKVNDIPAVVADNFFTPDEYESIFKELNHINSCGVLEDTLSATDPKTDEPLKRNKGRWIHQLYNDQRISPIRIYSEKILQLKWLVRLQEIHSAFIPIGLFTNSDILINYYDSLDKYPPHRDSSSITILYWFYDKPKHFTGGDLIFEGIKKIKCISNRMVVFPGHALHEVTPIDLPKDKQGKGLGRYSISQFLSAAT